MFLVVGLGNPGAEYAETRHNIGFMAADEIHGRYNFSSFKSKFDGLIAEGKIGDEKVYLLKPQTYMNLSGNSVVKAAMFYKILPQNIIVIHDDLDLKIGQLKAKCGGGAGGHNGLKSIDSHITPDYNRIRVGIGHPDKAKTEVADYVLGGFSKADAQIINQEMETVAEAVKILIEKGVDARSNYLGMQSAHRK